MNGISACTCGTHQNKLFFSQSNVSQRFGIHKSIQTTLLNPDMCNPDFRLNRTVWKVTFPSYTYKYYTHNPDFA